MSTVPPVKMSEPVVLLSSTSVGSSSQQKPKTPFLKSWLGHSKSSRRLDVPTADQKTALVLPETSNLENTTSDSVVVDEGHKQHSSSLDQVATLPTTESCRDVEQHAYRDSEPQKEWEGLAEAPSKAYSPPSSTNDLGQDRKAPLIQRVKTRFFTPRRNTELSITIPSTTQLVMPSSEVLPSEVMQREEKDQCEECAFPQAHSTLGVVNNAGEDRITRRTSMVHGIINGPKLLKLGSISVATRSRGEGLKVGESALPDPTSSQAPQQPPAQPEENATLTTTQPHAGGNRCNIGSSMTTTNPTQPAMTGPEPASSSIRRDGNVQSKRFAVREQTPSSPAVVDSEVEQRVSRRTSGVRSIIPGATRLKLGSITAKNRSRRKRPRVDEPGSPTSISDQETQQQSAAPGESCPLVAVPLRAEGNQCNPEMPGTSSMTQPAMASFEPRPSGIVQDDGKDQSDRAVVHEIYPSPTVVSNEEERQSARRSSGVRGMLPRAKRLGLSFIASATRPRRKGSRVDESALSSPISDQAPQQQTKEPEEKATLTMEPFRAEGNQSEPTGPRQSVRECEEVQRLHSRIAELEKRCEAQSRDIESSNSFLNATDKSSDSDVINAVRRLNAEVQQTTTHMADCLAEDFEFHNVAANPTKEQFSAMQMVSETIGDVLAKSLGMKSPAYIPVLLQVAFQAYLASALGQTASSWVFEPAHNKFITAIYQSLRASEAQAISGRWRSLARFHIVHSWVSHPDDLVRGIIIGFSYILLAAGCAAPQPQIISTMMSRFEQKVSLLVDLAGRLNRVFDEIISSDFEVLVVRPGVKFESKDMEDADDDHVGVQDASVLCSTHLGLIKRMPVGTLWEKGKKQKMMVLKPKVLLESFLDAED